MALQESRPLYAAGKAPAATLSKRHVTLERVTGLLAHPAFSIRNPNHVCSLIRAFSSGNPVHVHEPSGAGYRFLADRVLGLDPINPRIAAHLLCQMARWRLIDPERQGLTRVELERVLAAEDLAKNSYEVASWSLNG